MGVLCPISGPASGRIVHYRSFGTPRGEYTAQCRAAIVSEVDPTTPDRIGLVAVNPTGVFFHSLADGGSTYDDGAERPGSPDCPMPESHGNPMRYCPCGWQEATFGGGTWHWPRKDATTCVIVS